MFLLPSTNRTSMIFLMLLSSFMLLTMLALLPEKKVMILQFEFFKTLSTTFTFPIIIDMMSLLFAATVMFISASVITYSLDYMSNDHTMKKFTLTILLFVASMMFLIFSLNMISIMLGWDGLGLVSFILVAYYQNSKTNAASMLTALSNRLGDAALLIALGLMVQSSSWNFLMHPTSSFNKTMLLMVILAALTKSAQMPFSAWLPAAMAAPTPVSALVHSSTLVTAGIYLLIRFNPIINKLAINTPLMIIGLLTSIMASLTGCLENNLKKIVALSTLSQLGIMLTTLSMGFTMLSFFHLLTHATFKALLFLACGKIIHESNSSQDIRTMGYLMLSNPFTLISLNTSNFALCGMPFLAGFYSKDLIYETSIMLFNQISMISMLSLAIGLSSVYSMRMMFSSTINLSNNSPLHTKLENSSKTIKPMFNLILPSIMSGALLSWLILDTPMMIPLPLHLKMTTILMMLSGLTFGLIISSHNLKYKQYLKLILLMWHLPSLTSSLSMPLMKQSSLMKTVESGWLEFLSVQGSFSTLLSYSSKITKSQTNTMSTFLILFILSALLTHIYP
uniref:NADH-ubiquinone oxidoreductase chain 5 n=1 Tax=Asotana magnifica TaxID=2528170 RepID=A0A4P8DN86_9CRUS|nr:NADH dehydrogenase subunit 5 [Asotana magnifica]